MRTKLLTTLALMLCMGALFLPVTAYAASDSTPPGVNAWVDDDILRAEASDRDSGVEAVYVNGHRFGYLVDGAVEVSPLEDYAGEDEYITVHAIDFAGNKSREVKIKNPYYTAPKPTPAAEQPQTTPAPDPTPQPSAPPASSAGTTSRPSTTTPPAASTSQPSTAPSTPAPSAPDSEPTESAVPDSSASNPFTPDGTGSVQDNATESDGKEFFTIVTEAENTFYLVIDRQRDSEGVYLLNAVTEDDLMALAEKSGGATSGESVIPEPEPTPAPVEPDPTPQPDPEPEQPAKSNTGTIIFVLIAVLAVGGAGYYFKILKPKQQAGLDSDDEDDSDEYGEGEGYDDGDEYDFSDGDAEFVEESDPGEAVDEDGDPQ